MKNWIVAFPIILNVENNNAFPAHPKTPAKFLTYC
jgi:hypothetical protein